jgi:4-diphosphocytidyl-2-C-methyl-D-erythritol kinase
MIVFPKAKINIGLRITGKRSDGYHNIETLFYPVNLSDALEFVVSQEPLQRDLIKLTGLNTGGDPENNLVIKTVVRLRKDYSIPFLKIHLHKSIPAGAGLGGGSSDAVSFLKSLNRCFRLNMKKEEIEGIALEIGSDCPFFIESLPSYATGRGEILQPVHPFLTGLYLVLTNPGVEISTRDAYQNCNPEYPAESLQRLIEHPIDEWSELITNEFESYAFVKHPITGKIKEALYKSGALFSLMSGSGSSVFGIFGSKPVLPDSLKKFVIWEGIM